MNKLLLSCLFSIVFLSMTACSINEKELTDGSTQKEKSEEVQSNIPEFNQSIAIELMNQYRQVMTSLFEEANEELKITTYQSKEEVKQYFEEVMSVDYAATMADSFFIEKEGGLYVIARETPTWLNAEKPFDLEKESETHYTITQEQKSDLTGHVKMVYHAVLEEGNWRVSDIESIEINSQTKDEDAPREDLQEMAHTVINYIAEKDFEALSILVDSEKGALFSPYVYLESHANIFQREDIPTFFENDQVYTWGTFDGSGESIELTPSQYYDQFIYDKPYANPDEILINELKQRGNTINSIKDTFPNSHVVEFHLVGSSEFAGMDWASLNLVFEKGQNGTWTLVAIVNDRWTI